MRFIHCSTGEGGLNMFQDQVTVDYQEASWIGQLKKIQSEKSLY